MYDVVIIGAGPAGSTAAKALAERGKRVLLVERFQTPRYKSCTGMVIKKSLDLIERYFEEALPPSVTCAPAENKGMVFTSDTGREYRFEQAGRNVWRSLLDGWLANKAAASGAVFMDKTAALACEEQENCVTVTLKGQKVFTQAARYVLLCEGAAGVLKRRLFGEKTPRIVTYQAFYRGEINLDPHYFYAYLQPAFSQYDAWFNVKDHLLVLGVAAKEPEQIPHCYQRFIAYMQRQNGLRLTERVKEDRWLMPQIRPGCKIDSGKGRILLAGECAGFLNPMGEGISAGIESGRQAACAIAAHFEAVSQVRQAYLEGVEPLRAYMQRQWDFVSRISGGFGEMREATSAPAHS